MANLTKQMIQALSGQYDPASVARLDLSGKGLSDVSCLQECTNLEVLDLSGNNLTDLRGIDGLECLRSLNLSGNSLRELHQIAQLKALVTLNVAGNNIASIDSLDPLAKLPKLRMLTLKSEKCGANPCCDHPAYYMRVLKLVDGILALDGERVKLKESMGDALVEKVGRVEEDKGLHTASEREPWIADDALWGEGGILGKQFDFPGVDGEVAGGEFEEKDLLQALGECKDILEESDRVLKKATGKKAGSGSGGGKASRKKSRR